MSEEYKNLYIFLDNLEKQINKEIKENNLKKMSNICEYIENIINNKLVYFDYIRDVEIVNEFETEVCISNLFKIEENEGIASFLNRVAKFVLFEHFTDKYYKDNFNKRNKEVIKK